MSVATQRSRRRLQREEVRTRILDAAGDLLRERPYRELTVEQVMSSAGLSRTIFYRHFDDLPHLVLRLLEEPSADLLERERQLALEDRPLADVIRQALEAPVEAFHRHGPLLRAVAEAASHDEVIERGFRSLMEQYEGLIAEYLRLLSELGQGRLRDHEQAARALNLMNVHFLLDAFGTSRAPNLAGGRARHPDRALGRSRAPSFVVSHIDPSPEQIAGFSEAELEGPIVMLNLLRFKDSAGEGADGLTGEEAYRRYGEAVAENLARVGGSLLHLARCSATVIGPEFERWDLLALVSYPSRAAFLEMVSDPDFLAKHEYRTAALQDSRLICCQPLADDARS